MKILKEFNREDLLVIINVDFGHTDPQIILPLRIKAKITTSPIFYFINRILLEIN